MPQRFVQASLTLRLCRLLLCGTLLLGPQVVLQLVAWSYMLVSYSQESSVSEAVADTFSGQRPCGLCHMLDAVEEEKEAQGLSIRAADDFRLLIPRLERVVLSAPPAQNFAYPQHASQRQNLPWSVPAPPPKQVS